MHTFSEGKVGSGGCLRNMTGTHYLELTFNKAVNNLTLRQYDHADMLEYGETMMQRLEFAQQR